MDTQYVLEHLGHVFCFWIVWKMLDLGWHLFDVQLYIERLAGRKDQQKAMAEIVKTLATKEDQSKLAKGLADIIIGMHVMKRQSASVSASQVTEMKKNFVPNFDDIPNRPRPKKGRALGVQKLVPIPLADEATPESVKKGRTKIKKHEAKKPMNDFKPNPDVFTLQLRKTGS